jgi:hypothetical protein
MTVREAHWSGRAPRLFDFKPEKGRLAGDLRRGPKLFSLIQYHRLPAFSGLSGRFFFGEGQTTNDLLTEAFIGNKTNKNSTFIGTYRARIYVS